MSRRPNSVPTSRLHKASGQASISIRLPGGQRQLRYLGPYDSAESRAAYSQMIAELAVQPIPAAVIAPGPPLTLDALLLAYHRWADGHYRKPDGKPSSALSNVEKTIEVVRRGYQTTPAADFGPLALK